MRGGSLGRGLLALMLAVGVSGGVLAATKHAHDGHGAPAVELKLNNGQKWPTDDALRRGMAAMRADIGNSLPRIHGGRYSNADFAKLADRMQKEIDGVVANCKLPEDADAQLHVVIEQLIDATAALKGKAGQAKAVAIIVDALNAYGKHFDHPEWKPLTH